MNRIEKQLQILEELRIKITDRFKDSELVFGIDYDSFSRPRLQITVKGLEVLGLPRREIFGVPQPQPGTLDYLKWFIFKNNLEEHFLVLTEEEKNYKSNRVQSEKLETTFIPVQNYFLRLSQKDLSLKMLKHVSNFTLEEKEEAFVVVKQHLGKTEPSILNYSFKGWQEPYFLELVFSSGRKVLIRVENRNFYREGICLDETTFSKCLVEWEKRYGSFKMFILEG